MLWHILVFMPIVTVGPIMASDGMNIPIVTSPTIAMLMLIVNWAFNIIVDMIWPIIVFMPIVTVARIMALDDMNIPILINYEAPWVYFNILSIVWQGLSDGFPR